MKVTDEIWLCSDCLHPAVNDDWSSLDYHYSPEESEVRYQAIREGFERLGGRLVANFDTDTGDGHRELGRMPCDCCGMRLHGDRYRFMVLG